MSKKEFKELSKERYITSCRYQGKTHTMFIDGSKQTLTAFLSFLKNYDLPFNVKIHGTV